jgi:hypothetical protein
MAMTKRFYFNVSGQHRFPLDMLRYDACWPEGSEDASNISLYERATREPNSLGYRTVALCSGSEPTPARWASFGWHVTDVKMRKF